MVVDEHVDVHDYEEVFFRVCANVDPKRDVVLADGPIDQLDHAAVLPSFGGKIGFDATAKGPDEGAREWPPEIEMTADVRARVDARWAGARRCPSTPTAEPCRMGAGSDGEGAGRRRRQALTRSRAGRLNPEPEHGTHGATE